MLIPIVNSERVDSEDIKQRQILSGIDQSILQHAVSLNDIKEKLRNLNISTTDAQRMIREDGRATRDLVVNLNKIDQNQKRYDAIIESLVAKGTNTRRDEVDDAFSDTYKWIFNSQGEAYCSWDDFVRWLRSGRDIYWVNGKAGSGKSTLMKFIWSSPLYKDNLKHWAPSRELILPSYFFNYASEEESNIAGLLRSLLLQALKAYPYLVMYVAPDMETLSTIVWSYKSLFESLDTIMNQETESFQWCFLIDGLDEFKGDVDHQDSLLNFLKKISGYEHVKLCISSRPEPHLLHAFKDCPKLRLQDFTFTDMLTYTIGQCNKYELMQKYEQEEPECYDKLIQDLPRKADGIFLWLRLAIQDLKSGIMKLDSLDVLQQRVDRLDSSLYGLFNQLLSAVNTVHLLEIAFYLKFIIERGEAPLLELAFGADKHARDNLWTLLEAHSSHTTDNITDHIARQQSAHKINVLLEDYGMKILTRFGGLLDIDRTGYDDNKPYRYRCDAAAIFDCRCRARHRDVFSPLEQVLLHYSASRIRLVHRSVEEFVRQDPQANQTINLFSITQVDLSLCVLKGCFGIAAADVKAPMTGFFTGKGSRSLAREEVKRAKDGLNRVMRKLKSMKEAGPFNHETATTAKNIASWIETEIPNLYNCIEPRSRITFSQLLSSDWLDFFLQYPAMRPEYIYPCNAMIFGVEDASTYFKSYQKDDRNTLITWCFLAGLNQHGFSSVAVELITALLDLGLNPNSQPGAICPHYCFTDLMFDDDDYPNAIDLSFWQLFLIRLHGLTNYSHVKAEQIDTAMCKFLVSGANPNANVKVMHTLVLPRGIYIIIGLDASTLFLNSKALLTSSGTVFSNVVAIMSGMGAKSFASVHTISVEYLHSTLNELINVFCNRNVEAERSQNLISSWLPCQYSTGTNSQVQKIVDDQMARHIVSTISDECVDLYDNGGESSAYKIAKERGEPITPETRNQNM